MTRPAPTDIVAMLGYIADGLDEIRAERDERRLSASAAARAMGFADSYFRQPWRIPDFGRSGTRHRASVWSAWLARPEAERRAEWDAMSVRERRAARRVA